MKAIALENDKTKSFFKDRYIWLLLIISLSVRIYLSFFTYVIKNDSVAFMQNAKYFASGDFARGLGHDYHPLYSLIMAVLYKVVPNMELSGTIISVLFGTLTVIVFYLIGKSVFDQKVSFVSSIILAFHPYAVRFSADIISESTYFFFFITALGSGFFAVTKRRHLLFALSGICSALAYLARPEGIGIIIIVVSFCALKDCTKIKALWKEKLISVLILTVSFLVFSMPYLVYIKKETGHWDLTKKKKLTIVAGIGELLSDQNNNGLIERNTEKKGGSSVNINNQKAAERTDFKAHLECVLYIAKRYLSTFHYLLFVLLIIGVINWTRIKQERFFGFYLTAIIVFYLFILYRLGISYALSTGDIYAPSRRHLMPLVIPAIFCVGIGIHTTGTWMHEKFQSNSFIVGFKELLKSTWIVQLLVLMIVVSVLLPKTLKPQRFDKLGIKEVGQWVKEHSHKPSPAILSTFARNAYYAGGKHVQMESNNNVLTLAQTYKADYILITYREFLVIEKEILQSIKDKKMTLAYKYPEKEPLNKRSVFLYKVLY
jgi:4-amino-4-deoxy-L-arabinose transferase-like glycosyltransferase